MSNRSNPSHALSFQAIQEQQASKPLPKGPPKSLRQIQDEEQEVAFLAWFEEESAKIQQAALLANVMQDERPKEQPGRGDKSGQGRRARGEQGGAARGRGRGRERGRGKEHPSSSALVS
jgi:hypothetical protein